MFPPKKVYNLPVNYDKLHYTDRKVVREQYIKEQNGLCFWCALPLTDAPIVDRILDLNLFPKGFLNSPIHLQHDHNTGLTEGAVHAYCNGIMWQYYGR
jgi:hypothetical protein